MSGGNKKSQYLGMPWGTAMHRLRKSILFKLVKKCGEDICCRCNKKIESVDQLSIEHKLPWEGIDCKLFWDLDNISFSHLKCNIPHRHSGGVKPRHICSNGFHWCSSCQSEVPIDQFCSDKNKWSGLGNRCKTCSREQTRKRRLLKKNKS